MKHITFVTILCVIILSIIILLIIILLIIILSINILLIIILLIIILLFSILIFLTYLNPRFTEQSAWSEDKDKVEHSVERIFSNFRESQWGRNVVCKARYRHGISWISVKIGWIKCNMLVWCGWELRKIFIMRF